MTLSEQDSCPTVEESAPYAGPRGRATEEWVTRAPATKALGLSRTRLTAAVRQGTVVSKVENGIRYFKVTAGAAKAMISAKERASEGQAEQAIVLAFAEGLSVPAIISELKCSPRVLARTLRDLQSALAVAREIRQEQREADELERIREIETGHPDVPTSWAWCDFLFRGDPNASPPIVAASYDDAKKKFDAWIAAGNKIEHASAYVLDALESREAWTVARRVWLVEVQKSADRKARETILEEHRFRMLAAKEETHDRVREESAARRTARLAKLASGKGGTGRRPGRPPKVSREANGESLDKPNGSAYGEPSEEEG